MAINLNRSNFIVRHYEKILVVVVLVGLVVSLFYLNSTATSARQREVDAYEEGINKLAPRDNNLTPVDIGIYEAGLAAFESPKTLKVPDNLQAGAFLPETRVVCVNQECGRLIAYTAQTCPFCKLKQPVPKEQDPNLDSDGDGIPDRVEIAWGLDPNDANDAHGDLDGDGFTNLEEYLAKTDPRDAKSHPPYLTKIQVKELRGKRLPLLFNGVNTLPDGKRQYIFSQLGTYQQTHWVEEGAEIGETGYKAGALTVKTEKQERGGNEIDVDVSTVVLERLSDRKKITLQIYDKQVKTTDVEAILLLTLDNTEYSVVEGGELKVRDETYEVLTVDDKKNTVTVSGKADGQIKVIRKLD